MYQIRRLGYHIAMSVHSTQALFRFMSKPGSRIIVPGMMIALAYLDFDFFDGEVKVIAYEMSPGYYMEPGLRVAVVVIGVMVATAAYVIFSRLLAVTIGAMPMMMQPLPPQRKLMPKKVEITPAVVRIVVPPLPRQGSLRDQLRKALTGQI